MLPSHWEAPSSWDIASPSTPPQQSSAPSLIKDEAEVQMGAGTGNAVRPLVLTPGQGHGEGDSNRFRS